MSDLPNLDGARKVLEMRQRSAWGDTALTDALAAVDILTAELAEARETLRSHGEEFKLIFAEVERRTGEVYVGRASAEVARMAEFLLDAMKRNMLAAQREQRRIGDAEVEGFRTTLDVRNRTINDAHAALDRARVSVGGSVAERVDILAARLAEAEATGRRRGLEEAALVCESATLPDGYQWGRDALESFNFGKERAALSILALAPKVTP